MSDAGVRALGSASSDSSSAAPPRGAWTRPRSWPAAAWLTIASLVATLPLPFLSASRYGDLSNWYTDHLHHAYATWVFFHRGLAIYTETFRVSSAGVPYPHAFVGPWADAPGMVYPPGVFLVFLPATLLGWLDPGLPMRAFGAVNIGVLLLYAHLTWGAFLFGLPRQPRGLRPVAAAVLWLLLMRAALNGFYDVVWLGAAAAMQLALLRDKPAQAVAWFGVAAMMHFRAVVMAPLAVYAAVRAVGGKSPRRWPWRTLAATAALCAVSLATFALMYPVTSGLRAAHPSIASQVDTTTFQAIVGSAVVFAGAAWWAGGPVAAVTCALVSAIGLSEMTIYRTFWWHSSVCFALLLLPGAVSKVRAPGWLRAVGAAQLVALETLVWADRQGGVLGLFVEFLSDYKLR